MANRKKISSHNKTPLVVGHSQILETYSGPLPDPSTLEKYKDADPSFPERIVRMAEAHNAADIITKKRFSLANLIVPIIGQVFTFILGGGGIVACIYLIEAGYPIGAVITITSTFFPIIINAIKGLRPRK